MRIFILSLVVIFLSFNALSHECRVEFPYKQNWLGADAAYSVKLGDDKTLWLFGDTFLGQKNRSFDKFLSNSIAISNCRGQIDYFYGDNHSDFFIHPEYNKGYKYWPKAGFIYKNTLYINLLEVKIDASGALGFKETATVMAQIENYNINPTKWKITYQPMTRNEYLFPGTEIIVEKNEVYSFATLVQEKISVLDDAKLIRPIVALKLNLENYTFKYLDKKNRWRAFKRKEQIKDAKILFESANTEMSVHYSHTNKEWIAIYSHASLAKNSIVKRTSKSLLGFWSEEMKIYDYPETSKDIFCYAGKAHSKLSSDQSLLITYVCNAFTVDEILSNFNIYRPQVFYLDI